MVDPTYIRVLSSLTVAPDPGLLVTALADEGFEATVDGEPSGDWRELTVTLAGGVTVTAERSLAEDPDSLVREEVAEFMELVEQAAPSDDRDRLRAYLARVRQVIAILVPDDASPADEDERTAIDALVDALRAATVGIIQVDGAGFFGAEGLILETG